MAKLSDIPQQQYTSNPTVKPVELTGQVLQIIGARGPYKSKNTAIDGEFCVITTHTLAGEVNDVLLSYVGQRVSLVSYFQDKSEPIGPVRLATLDVGKPSPMWIFQDVEDSQPGMYIFPPLDTPDDDVPF